MLKSGLLRAAVKLTLPVFAAYWLIGFGYGVFATHLQLAWWFPLVTAALVYSGSVEFILASLMLGAFRPLAVFVMAFLVGARHLFYGISMLDRFKGAGWRKFFMIYMLTDETFAVTFANPVPSGLDPHRFQLVVSVLVWLYWLTGTAMGTFLAHVCPAVDLPGMEFIMTAMFAAIFAENWRTEKSHAGSRIGLAVSFVALLLFGAEDFMLPAMGGILIVLTLLRRKLS